MKKWNLFSVLLVMLMVLVACEKENEPEKKDILVEDQTQLAQNVFADETTGKSGVSFTTTGAWSSTISTTTTLKSTAPKSSPDWISISPDSGKEAGDYTIEISLSENLTGSDRTATITIVCGETKITITVTQKATKEDGTVPEDGGVEIPKLISKVVYTSSYLTEKPTVNLSYDENNRISKIVNTDYDGENTEVVYNYAYSSDKITITGTYTNSEESGTVNEVIVLNSEGKGISVDGSDENVLIEYSNDLLYKVADRYDNYTCKWDSNGNMIQVISGDEGEDVQTAEYGTHLNNFNLDINWIFGDMYIGGISGIYADIFSNRSKNLMSKYKSSGGSISSDTRTYEYTFENDLLIKVTAKSPTGWIGVFEFEYQ